jgi:hypothetical protein
MRFAAVFGNLLFILWIIYNAIHEGLRGTIPEIISCLFLIGLLALNSYLVLTCLDREHMLTNKSN